MPAHAKTLILLGTCNISSHTCCNMIYYDIGKLFLYEICMSACTMYI